jgi:hypothetical protein
MLPPLCRSARNQRPFFGDSLRTGRSDSPTFRYGRRSLGGVGTALAGSRGTFGLLERPKVPASGGELGRGVGHPFASRAAALRRPFSGKLVRRGRTDSPKFRWRLRPPGGRRDRSTRLGRKPPRRCKAATAPPFRNGSCRYGLELRLRRARRIAPPALATGVDWPRCGRLVGPRVGLRLQSGREWVTVHSAWDPGGRAPPTQPPGFSELLPLAI